MYKRGKWCSTETKQYTCKGYREYVKYDLWRIMTQKEALTEIQECVLQYSVENIDKLDGIEYDYVVKIRIGRMKEKVWKNILHSNSNDNSSIYSSTNTSAVVCMRAVLRAESKEEVYKAYTKHLLQQESSNNMCIVIFYMLQKHKGMTREEKAQLVQRMYYDSSGNVCTAFVSWVPNLTAIRQKRYMEYLHKYIRGTERCSTDKQTNVCIYEAEYGNT